MLIHRGLGDLQLVYNSLFTCFFSTPWQEIGSRLCITCPRHKYKISLGEGEGMFKATDTSVKPPLTKWFTKGVKQRVHAITETDGDIYVTLSDAGWVESDYFQGEKGKEKRAQAEETDKAS